MDRSRTFSSVHGERAPGDKHAAVHFYQDGLPFDAQGFMLPGCIDPEDTKLVKLAEGKLKKAQKSAPAQVAPTPADDADGDGDDDANNNDSGEAGDDASLTVDDVNLEAWLRGEQRVPWHLVAKKIGAQYKKRVSVEADAVEFLVSEMGVVPVNQIAAAFKKHLA